MRITDAIVNFELINNDAQNNAIFSSSENKSFGNLELLNIQTKKQTPFMDFELNQSILDGSLTDFIKKNKQILPFLAIKFPMKTANFKAFGFKQICLKNRTLLA